MIELLSLLNSAYVANGVYLRLKFSMEEDGSEDIKLISMFLEIGRKFHNQCYSHSLVSMNETNMFANFGSPIDFTPTQRH